MAFLYPGNTRMTARAVDKLQLERRRQEQEALAIHQFTQSNQLQTLQNQSDAAVAGKRRANHAAQLTAEKMLEESHAVQQAARSRNDRETQQNQRLAHALERSHKQQEQKERELQRIVESSEELRELEVLLKTAYMNKERAVQQLERQTLQAIDKSRDVAIEQQMEYDRQRALVDAQNKALAKRADAVQAKTVLQNQMIQRQELRKEADDEAERERQKIDALIQQIEREDAQEIAQREVHRDQTRAMIRRTHTERERARALQRAREQQDEDRIAEYRRSIESREAGVKAANDQKKAEEDARFRAVEAEIKAKRQYEQEIEQLRDELWAEELHRKKEQEEEEKRVVKAHAKDEMLRSNEIQRKLKQELLVRQQHDEDAFNDMLQQKFASEARRDMERAAFQRKQKEEYKREIERHNAIKQQMLHEELQHEQRERERQEREDEYRRQVIAQAKQRLLQEHAEVLQGFMPRALRPPSSSTARPGSGSSSSRYES